MPEHGPPSVDGALSSSAALPDEQSSSASSQTDLQSNSAFALHVGESVQPDKSQPSHILHWESDNHMSEQSLHSCPTALLSSSSPSSQEFEQRSYMSQAERVENPASEAPLFSPPVAKMNLLSTAGEEWTTAECVSCPSVTEGLDQGATVGLNELEGVLEIPPKSAENHADRNPEAEIHAPLKAEDGGPPSPEPTESPSVKIMEVSQDVAPQPVSSWKEKEDSCISPHTSLENAPNMSDVSEMMFEDFFSINLMPCAFFLSGVVSLSLVMQAPSALFLIGLLLVLHCL